MNLRKGQSAIEYLTTYGWAILAIVVVGAVVMQYVGQRCPESAQGFTGQDLEIAEWALDSESAQLLIRNQAGGKQVEIVNVDLGDGEKDTISREISYGSEENIEVSLDHGIAEGECYSAPINITYHVGEGENRIANKTVSGTLNGRY